MEKPWERTTKQIQEEELAVCEGVRAFLAEKLVPFTETMKKKGQTARAFTECLYDFLVECRMQEVLSAREQALEESGDLDRAKEYHQIYGIILELLDKVVELLGEEEITLEEYEQILEAGFEEAKAGMIPPEPDRVMVGDLERSRLKNIKVLFFIGLNDGLVPSWWGRRGLPYRPGEGSPDKYGSKSCPGNAGDQLYSAVLPVHAAEPSNRAAVFVLGKSRGGRNPSASIRCGRADPETFSKAFCN